MPKRHLIKAEVNTTQKLLLVRMAEEQKRSVKKQTEFIIEDALKKYARRIPKES